MKIIFSSLIIKQQLEKRLKFQITIFSISIFPSLIIKQQLEKTKERKKEWKKEIKKKEEVESNPGPPKD